MKRLSVVIVLSIAALAAQAQSGQIAYARVLSSEPIYETYQVPEGREVCRREPVTYVEPVGRSHRRSESGEILGTIIGGVIGNQFGSGRGRTAATVGGAILGGAIARDSQRNSGGYTERRYTRDEEVCEWVEEYREESEIVGYDVSYEYQGIRGRTTTQNPPGQTIAVRVSVDAVE